MAKDSKTMTLHDWITEPKNRYRCEVTRRGAYLYGGWTPARRETHYIYAATMEAAERVAEYHYFSSIIHLIEESENG